MAEGTFRLRVKFGKTGRLRFLSHLEVVRACERSIRRARLEYAVTLGFNRRIKMAFGPALPVGTAGLGEMYDLWVRRFISPAEALGLLRGSTPEDLAPFEALYLPESAPSLGAAMTIADYEVLVDCPDGCPDDVRAGLEAIVAGGSLALEHKGKSKVFDLTICLPKGMEVRAIPGGAAISITTRMGAWGSLRPEALVAQALERSSVSGAVTAVTRIGLQSEKDA